MLEHTLPLWEALTIVLLQVTQNSLEIDSSALQACPLHVRPLALWGEDTESQKTEQMGWKDPEEVVLSSPTAQRSELAQGCAQSGFQYLYGQTIHNLSMQPVPVFDHPHSTKNKTIHVSALFPIS